MKNLILSVFATVLISFLPSIANSQIVDKALIPLESSDGLDLRLNKEMTPIYRTPRHGDRLWDYARQYNIGHPKEIVEFNKGKVGEKCIKNENLILRGCKIAIPVYTKTQVQIQQTRNEEIVDIAIYMAIKQEHKNGESKSLIYMMGMIAFGVLSVILALFFLRYHGEAEHEKNGLRVEHDDLASKLWAAEDKVKKMESVLPGNYVELQSRENGKIKAKIIKVRLGKNGELEVYVACPAEEHCLVNASENLKLENALSHVYKQHGTNQDLKPNGWTE